MGKTTAQRPTGMHPTKPAIQTRLYSTFRRLGSMSHIPQTIWSENHSFMLPKILTLPWLHQANSACPAPYQCQGTADFPRIAITASSLSSPPHLWDQKEDEIKWVGKTKNFTEVWKVPVRSLRVRMASPNSGQSWRNGALSQALGTLRYL